MSDRKTKGYMEKVLFIDCETSGLAFNSPDPSFNSETGETYQAVSWGMIVANARTLEPVDTLYVEIKWNGVSVWSESAQRVHGLSLAYLEEHGLTEEEAVVQIAELILKHWGPDSSVAVGGHNVATFDLQFLRRLLTSYGIDVRFSNRTIDTFSIGFGTLGTFNSDDLFDAIGLPPRDPEHHNALADADSARRVVQTLRRLVSHCIGGE